MSIRSRLRKRLELLPAPAALEQHKIGRSRQRIARGRLQAKPGQRRLFIDVSVIAQNDSGTGIQRVVRGLALRESQYRAAGWDVWYVAATRKQQYHRIQWPVAEGSKTQTDFTPIKGGHGDVFLGLDYALDIVRYREAQIEALAASGVRILYLIHDLLPLHKPEWFTPRTGQQFRKWLRILASTADTILCNSEQTQTDVRHALAETYKQAQIVPTRVLPMGNDIGASQRTGGLPEGFAEWLNRRDTPLITCVSTLEPRKGHNDLLDAFSQLWDEGSELRLLLVGRKGWKVEELVQTIQNHPCFGTHLFWRDDLSDEALIQTYQASDGIVVPSLAEGYGLPVIEALNYSKPVLARDLPVFRVHTDSGVRFFASNASAEEIATDILKWSQDIARGNASTKPAKDSRWEDSADVLVEVLGL